MNVFENKLNDLNNTITCFGNGKCLIPCECTCFNKTKNKFFDICICGHKNHNGYCPSDCCILIECRNHKKCETKLPQWIINCHKGLCDTCSVQMGSHTYLNSVEECNICLEWKQMIKLQCNHHICNDCWYDITLDSNEEYVLCPFCRSKN